MTPNHLFNGDTAVERSGKLAADVMRMEFRFNWWGFLMVLQYIIWYTSVIKTTSYITALYGFNSDVSEFHSLRLLQEEDEFLWSGVSQSSLIPPTCWKWWIFREQVSWNLSQHKSWLLLKESLAAASSYSFLSVSSVKGGRLTAWMGILIGLCPRRVSPLGRKKGGAARSSRMDDKKNGVWKI